MSVRRLSAWLELLRVSNAPTVVSNAMTGCALAVADVSPFPWGAFALAAPALVLIYIAGMALNDALDADVDRVERPGRPIPSGRVGRKSAVVFAVLANGAALGLLAARGWPALGAGAVLVATAFLYNVLHRAQPATVVLMGACRALAVITAAIAVGWPTDFGWAGPAAAVIGLYVVGLSLVARREAGNPRRIKVVIVLVCGVSLVDSAILLLLRGWPEAVAAAGCFLLALAGQGRFKGS